MILSKLEDDNNYLYELNINDYRKLYKGDTSNIYRDLKKAVKSMEGTGFYLINSNIRGIEKETFFVWFASIDYLETEGKIIVEVGQRLKGLLIEMKKRIYYKIAYPLNFSSIYSKRIYYYIKSFEDTGWRIDNLDKLRNKLQCPKSYDKYGLFRTKVLDMAYEEINNCSDILFDYEEIKTGRKVTSIKFTIKKKKDICSEICATKEEPEEEKHINTNNIKLVKSIIHNINDDGANKIFNAANGNIENIKEKYSIISKFKTVKNLTGAMIQAIKEDLTINGISNITFNNFEGREYDYEDLEKKLLGWDKQ
ncbi:RepB family plasmid replication initiator protein [Clostridium sp. ZBS12]|uniref:replication initiation protein n=1 Tax=Clostridium sp. ZBS12 TaxID=2949972 RepID=UPI002079CBD6|nr:RepB family plasmid replication initiator protein [Clostridium sp. ZBS12]